MKNLLGILICIFYSTFISVGLSLCQNSSEVGSKDTGMLIKEIKLRVNAQNSLLDCALFLAETQKDTVPFLGIDRFKTSDKGYLLGSIAVGFAKSGEYARAFEIAEKIEFINDKNLTISAINEIKENHYKYYDLTWGPQIRHSKSLLDLRNEIKKADTLNNTKKAMLLSDICQKYAAHEQFEEAIEVLNKIEENFSFVKKNKEDLLKNAKPLLVINDEPVYADDNYNVQYKIKDIYFVTKHNILISYLRFEKFTEALRIFESIDDPLIRIKLLAGTALSYSQKGDNKMAVDTLINCLSLVAVELKNEPYDTADALVFIFDKYNRTEIPINDEVKNILGKIVDNFANPGTSQKGTP